MARCACADSVASSEFSTSPPTLPRSSSLRRSRRVRTPSQSARRLFISPVCWKVRRGTTYSHSFAADIKRTQSDICKAAALTEVTLRKCYREVAVHAKALLPPTYVPAVPIDRALGLSFPTPVSFVQYAGTQQPAPYVPPNGPHSQPISPRPPQQHQPHPPPHASQPHPVPPPRDPTNTSPTQPQPRTSPTAPPPPSGATALSSNHTYRLPSYPLQYYAPTPPPHQKRPPD